MRSNGKPPKPPAPPRATGRGTIPEATAKRLERRSELFALMTSGKGKPMTYGASKRDKT
jgi:hypothetical protein